MPLSPLEMGAWKLLKQLIRMQFPHVRQISTAALASWFAQPDRPQPILLDTRMEAEFAISHLQGAQRFDPYAEEFVGLETLALETAIVAYCSVGYRSAGVCDRLQAAGFCNVLNLEGSIFQWANEGRPLYRGDQVVQQVHPNNPLWGKLLLPERQAFQSRKVSSIKS